jgi:hypothetical protein
LKILDTGFRRYDGKDHFLTFYNFMKPSGDTDFFPLFSMPGCGKVFCERINRRWGISQGA